jgi:hypothetical protein
MWHWLPTTLSEDGLVECLLTNVPPNGIEHAAIIGPYLFPVSNALSVAGVDSGSVVDSGCAVKPSLKDGQSLP